MGHLWTPDQDLMLLAARARLQADDSIDSAEAAQAAIKRPVPPALVAEEYNRHSQIKVSADAARNRLKRLDAEAKANEGRPASPEADIVFEDIEVPKDQFVGIRMGFFDLETTDLKALMGRLLVASVADSWGNVTTRTIYDFPQESVIDDKGIAVWTRDELEKYDLIVGWNSKMFDQPFLNARLLRWGEKPWLGAIHQDPMWTVRAGSYGLRIGSSKLVNVSKFFDRGSSVEKTEIAWDLWAMAQSGDKDAMAYLVEHCEHDVLVLRSVWNHMKSMFRTYHR